MEEPLQVDTQVILEKSTNLDDWYLLVREEHDNQLWWEEEKHGRSLHLSERLVSNSCIEGTSGEMRSILEAIQQGKDYEAYRCAVEIDGDSVLLWSPRNSLQQARITLENAEELARQGLALLKQDKDETDTGR